MKRLLVILFLQEILAYTVEVPTIISVTPLEPPGFYIKWVVVSNSVFKRILGYKIKLWKVQEDEQGSFTLVNGDEIPGLHLDKKPLEPLDKNKPPKGEPRVIVVHNSSTEKAKVFNVNYETLYEIRICAYKENEDLILSDPVRAKIMKGDAYYVFVKKQTDSCMVSVASNVTIAEEAYYHLETMYF